LELRHLADHCAVVMDLHDKRVVWFTPQHLSVINSRYEAVRGPGCAGRVIDLGPKGVNISGRLGDSHSELPKAHRRYTRGPGPATRRDSRDRTPLMRAAAGGTAEEEQIMPAIKGTHAASHQRTSSQNGLPESVPYVYGQQTRRNTYATRIAQRNAQGWWQLPGSSPGAWCFAVSA
jgi:hypothetical protein